MKNIGSYIGSFIVSVMLVFSLLLTLLITVVNGFANPDKLSNIMDEKNTAGIVHTQLEKYFREKQNTSGIPAEIYMDSISEEYINDVIHTKINNGFYALIGVNQSDRIINNSLETALNDFYSDYADSINHPKNAEYDEKLSTAKSNAYKIIEECCDVFKFDSMQTHGILKKAAPYYGKIPTLVLISCGLSAFLALVLILVNLKSTSAALYWLGVSAIVSGIIGAVPCFYLRITNYFSAFTIKQPQVYTAYTGAMNAVVNSLLTAFIAAIASGIVLIVVYGLIVIIRKNKALADE